MTLGANELTLDEIEQMLSDEMAQATPPANPESATGTTPAPEGDLKGKEGAKAFAARLKAETEKARQEAFREAQEQLAKLDGFNSYEEKVKAKEAELLKAKGIDDEDSIKAIDEIVKKRIDSDPRIKELEQLRQKQVEEFGLKQLGELSKLTNGEVSKPEHLSKEVLDLWKSTGDLKSAWLSQEGAKFIAKMQDKTSQSQSSFSTTHLGSHGAGPSKIPSSDGKRPPTAEEIKVYKIYNPHATDEQIAKLRY